MAEPREFDGGGSWSSPRARLRIWLAAPTVIVIQFSGHLDLAHAQHMMAAVDRLRHTGRPVDAFNDWQAMESYDHEARLALTEWVRRIRPSFRSLHILQRSKIVSMGVSVANLALGGLLRAYTDRDSFQRALATISGGGTAAPLPAR